MCPGTELNRYDRCGSQDFKSCVSTSSTTGAVVFIYIKRAFIFYPKKLNCMTCGSSRFNRDVSTSSTTGAIIPKKNPPAKTDGLMSGRPGSNRPPRPWQGRALPNELLPLIKKYSIIPIAIGRATSACYLTNKRT